MNETSKIGRPILPKKVKKGLYMSFRLSPSEEKEIAQAIKDSGMKKGTWIRTKLIAAARRA